jgi:butyryl-CoA dehydrogenase
MDEVLSGARPEELEGPLGEERRLVASAKKIGLFAAGVVTQKYMQAIQDQQEIMSAIANITMETYAMESAVLRACKLVGRDGESKTGLVTAMTRDVLRTQMAILRRLSKYEPFDSIALRQRIAQRVIEAGKYVLA